MIDDLIISHIGIAVTDLDKSIETYRLLIGSEPKICEVIDQKVRVAIFSGGSHSGGRVELVAPLSGDSPVARFIQKRGEGLHHICFYVENIKQKLDELKKSGYKLIDETARVGAEGNPIAFVHPKSTHGVLIELEEKKTKA